MRDRLHGYTQAQTDRLVFSMFWECPSEAFVGRMLGLSELAVEQALERTCTRISGLIRANWQERLARQIDDLISCLDRLSEIDPVPVGAVPMRVRAAALRQAFLAAAAMPATAHSSARTGVPDATQRPPERHPRRFDRTRAPELVAAE